jgi:steroid delta-isomerase
MALEAWVRNYNAQDYEGAAKVWAKDLLGWGSPGSEDDTFAREQEGAKQPKSAGGPPSTFALTINEILVSGDLALVRDTWVETLKASSGGPGQERTFRSFEIWRKQADKSWKIARWIDGPVSATAAGAKGGATDELLKIAVENDKRFDDGIRRKDIDALASIYAEDAEYVRDNYPILSGRAAIRGDWAEALEKGGIKELALTPHTVRGTREIIYETGTGIAKDAQPEPYLFKYVNVWVRQADGSYKLAVDTYNNLLPSK